MATNRQKPYVVLSVDWDYFFPNSEVYDWGHSEHNPLFFDFIWQTRPGNRNILKPNDSPAIDVMWPRDGFLDFWLPGRVIAKGHRPKRLFLAESHSSMIEFLKGKTNLVIHNVDAHHDLGYGKGDDGLRPDCGNWAASLIRQGRVLEYRQHYPEWRKDDPEGEPGGRAWPDQATHDHSLPSGLKPDAVFVCRSSCWCPSWADDDWMAFMGGATIACAGGIILAVEFVTSPRDFDEKKARKMAEQFDLIRSQAMRDMAAKKEKEKNRPAPTAT